MAIEEKRFYRNGVPMPIQCLLIQKAASANPNAPMTLHYHDYFELLYGVSGQSLVQIGTERMSLGVGDLVLVQNGAVHAAEPQISGSSYIVIKFLPSVLFAEGHTLSEYSYTRLFLQNAEETSFFAASELTETPIPSLFPRLYAEWAAGEFGPTISNAPLAASNPAAHIAVDLGVTAAEDVIKRPMGIILAFEQDGKLMVSDSTITGNYKNVGVTPVRGAVSAFLEGNAVYREAMNQYGYSTGNALNAASLATGTCYIEFTGDTEDLLVNGKAAASGEFAVGSTLLFENDTTESIGIELDGEIIAPDIRVSNSATWVVPEQTAITLVCEQEAP